MRPFYFCIFLTDLLRSQLPPDFDELLIGAGLVA
jgi:hypothetical protein